jgi:hypothetical protein
MNDLIVHDDNRAIAPMASAATSHAVALAGALLDKRIASAKQWPRSISQFKREATQLLHEDIETARSAEYAKPVGGGTVTGPSVRLAEIAAYCWKNIDVEISDPIISENSVTVQAFAWDMERNTRMPGIASMPILKSNGQRYPQHMIDTTTNATASKARRNAILAVIPRSFINDLLVIAKEVASKNRPPLEEVRAKLLQFFENSHRVSPQQVCEYLSVKGVDDIGYEHVDELRAVAQGIKEGEPVEGYFGKSKTKAEIAAEAKAKRDAAKVNEPTN